MKLSLVWYLFVAFFGAGLVFFRLLDHFAEQKFRFSLSRAAGCVWVSAGISALTWMVHHRWMLLSEHLIFDALGMLYWAVMLACAVALARELRAARRPVKEFPSQPHLLHAVPIKKVPVRRGENKCSIPSRKSRLVV